MFQDLLTNFSSDIPGYKDNEGEGGSNDRSAGSPIVIEERVAVLEIIQYWVKGLHLPRVYKQTTFSKSAGISDAGGYDADDQQADSH